MGDLRRWSLLPALLLALCWALPGQGLPPPRQGQPLTDKERNELLGQLAPGQSSEHVRRNVLGAPHRSARQLVYRHYREQWVYGEPLNVRLEFETVRGDLQLRNPPYRPLGPDGR
jgi:hypothetical protein